MDQLEIIAQTMSKPRSVSSNFIETEEYTNIQKNLANRSKDMYNRLLSEYSKIIPRLEANKQTKLSDLVKELKKDVNFKLETKKAILSDMREKSQILKELYKKK